MTIFLLTSVLRGSFGERKSSCWLLIQACLYQTIVRSVLSVSRSCPYSCNESARSLSNPSTKNQRISTPAHSNVWKLESNWVRRQWYKSNKRGYMGSKTRFHEASLGQQRSRSESWTVSWVVSDEVGYSIKVESRNFITYRESWNWHVFGPLSTYL